jgi:hypothetical protein
MAWNYLQKVCCDLFVSVIGPVKLDVRAVWYSQDYDRPTA